jgi:O-antigen/teichoic acid export membrane protein
MSAETEIRDAALEADGAEIPLAAVELEGESRPLPQNFPRARVLSVLYSLTDQALAVGGGFLANVALARTQTKEEYGMFALSYSVFALLLALYHAAVLEPYTIYGSGRYREHFSEYLRLMLKTNVVVGIALTAVLLLICKVLSWVAPHLVPRALWGLAWTAAILLSGHLLRRAFYLQRQPIYAAGTSMVFFIVVGAGIWLTMTLHRVDSFTMFLVLAAAWIAAAGIFGDKLALGGGEQRFLHLEPGYWQEHWKYSKWVLATAIVFQFTTQAYYWLSAVFLSAKEVGELRAMYLLVAPMDQIFIAISFLVVPALSARYSTNNMRGFISIWKRYVLSTLLLTGGFALAVRLIGRSGMHIVYAGKYDGLAPYLFLLAFLPIFSGIGSTINNAVIATEQPKLVFYAYACSGAATLLGGIVLVRHFGLRGAVYGMLLSGSTFTAALGLAFAARFRRHLAPASGL